LSWLINRLICKNPFTLDKKPLMFLWGEAGTEPRVHAGGAFGGHRHYFDLGRGGAARLQQLGRVNIFV